MVTKHKVSSVKEISGAAFQSSTAAAGDKLETAAVAERKGTAELFSQSGGRDQPLLFSVDDPKSPS
jgi:hypothetical protein